MPCFEVVCRFRVSREACNSFVPRMQATPWKQRVPRELSGAWSRSWKLELRSKSRLRVEGHDEIGGANCLRRLQLVDSTKPRAEQGEALVVRTGPVRPNAPPSPEAGMGFEPWAVLEAAFGFEVARVSNFLVFGVGLGAAIWIPCVLFRALVSFRSELSLRQSLVPDA